MGFYGYTANNSCKDCQKRYVGCHSECEKYADYRARLKKVRDAYYDYHNNRAEYVRQLIVFKKNSKNYKYEGKNYVIGGNV